MNRYALLFTLILAASSSLRPQPASCGSDLRYWSSIPLDIWLDLSSRLQFPLPKGSKPDTVALTVHLVETQSAPSKMTGEELDRELGAVNQVFSEAGIYFRRCGPVRIINGQSAYTFTTGDRLNGQYHVPNTLNLYYADWLQTEEGFPLCGYSSFPWTKHPVERYIMMAKPCLDNGITLAHEIGHFFGLYHTHETYFGAELVDGSNCSFAGDKVCDTAADPNLSRGYITANCSYQGAQKDARGQTYRPPVNNLMSYAPSQCRTEFSAQQMAVMRSVLEKENAYLYRDCDFYPDFAITFNIGSSVTIRSGDPVPVSYTFENVGVNREYELDLHFSIAETPYAISTPIRQEVLTLRPGEERFKRHFTMEFPGNRGSGQYYLIARIDTYNEVVERREDNNAVALSVRVDNSGLPDARLFPNPVQDELRFFLRDARVDEPISLCIFRCDGRLVRELPEMYKEDEELLSRISVADLPTGLYLLSVGFAREEKPYTFRFFKE